MVHENHHNACFCKDKKGFFITHRQASFISAITFLSIILIIILSYLWGQKHAIQEFTNKMVDDSFADKINYSYYSLYGNMPVNDNDVDESFDSDEDFIEEPKPEADVTEPISQVPEINNNKHYYAELVGFGNIKSAQQFYDRSIKKGQPVKIKTRQSKGSKGKVVTWYQVVTESFEDKLKLEALVNKIKKSEHLKNIKILEI